jgi:diacylglycerol kinase family enzyme
MTSPRKSFSHAGRRVALLVNPYSAKGKWIRTPRLRQFFQRNFPDRVFDEARDKPSMIELARGLSLDNDMLVVLGGDGTLADVMQGIFSAGRQNDVVLGILPLGSGNALRSSLQIPKQISRALKVLNRGEPRPIDLIKVDGQIANLVSIGATAVVTHKKSQSTVPGLLGYLLASRLIFTHPRQERTVTLFNGRDYRGRRFEELTLKLKLFDCVINKTNHFGYNWTIAPKAQIDDGYLDVTLFDIRAHSYIFYFPLIYLGHYQKILKHFKVRRMIVRGSNLQIQYNGEPMAARDSVEITVLPKALRVIAPRRTIKNRDDRSSI